MIVVTGGAGFIGSALIWGLNEKGIDRILIVDNVETTDKWKNLVKRKFQSLIAIEKFSKWLEDPANLKQVECIFHMGACSSTTERDMDFLLRNNVDYTVHLFNVCKKHKIPFIYASSAATYGVGNEGFSDAHDKIDTLRPINPYGYSKQLADRWILEAAKEGENPFWCGLKFFNVYGPNEYHKEEMRSLVAKAYPQVQSTGVMRLFKSYKQGIKDGDQSRDFIYIKDIVKMMLHVFEQYKYLPNASGIYNFGTGTARSFLNLGESLFHALSLPPRFEFIPMPEDIRDQYQYFTEAKMDKFTKNFKYTNTMTSLEDGVADYVRNYLSSGDPYL